MSRWDNLNMAQRSELMSLYIKHGIKSLNDIKAHYNKFAEGGPVDPPPMNNLPIGFSFVPSQSNVNNPFIPTTDKAHNAWLKNWYTKRSQIVGNNFLTHDGYTTNNNFIIEPYGINKYYNDSLNSTLNAIDKASKSKVNFIDTDEAYSGSYNLTTDEISLNKNKISQDFDDTLFHERVHALNNWLPTYLRYWGKESHKLGNLSPFEEAVSQGLKGYYQNSNNVDTYLDSPWEVYARLMEFRKANNLLPTDYQSKEKIHKWRKSGLLKKNSLDRYDDDTLLYLFNEVASNGTGNETSNYAANGGNLFKNSNLL